MKVTVATTFVLLFTYITNVIGYNNKYECLKKLGSTALSCFHPSNMKKCLNCLREHQDLFETMYSQEEGKINSTLTSTQPLAPSTQSLTPATQSPAAAGSRTTPGDGTINQALENSCKPIPIHPKVPQPIGRRPIIFSGKCIDVPGGNSASGTVLDIYTCNKTPAQDWTWGSDGTIRAFGKCMDVQNGKTVQLNDCNGTPAQQWVLTRNGQMNNIKSNRCLDAKERKYQDSQPLTMFDCNPPEFSNQAFESSCKPIPIIAKDPQPIGLRTLILSGKCVDVSGGNSTSGTLLDIYTCNETPAQDWTVGSDGTIRAFGKCMDVQNGKTDNLTSVQLYDCNGTPAQQWIFLSSGQLKNSQSNRCLDVKDFKIQDGQPLIIYDCKQTDFGNQALETSCKLIPVPPKDPQPTGRRPIILSGKCFNVRGGNSTSGTLLDIYTCNKTPAQDWTWGSDGTIRALGKCMDGQNGETVQLYDCNGTPTQQWVLIRNGQMKNIKSNRCLGAKERKYQDSQPLTMHDCDPPAFESSCRPS